MFHKIKEVKSLENYILEVIFEDNTKKYYDVNPLFSKWEIFNDLRIIDGLFKQVKVDVGGYGIFWNEEIDLSCNELWENGKQSLLLLKKSNS